MEPPTTIDGLVRGILSRSAALSPRNNDRMTTVLGYIQATPMITSQLRNIWAQLFINPDETASLEMYIRSHIMPMFDILTPVLQERHAYILLETEDEWVIKRSWDNCNWYIHLRINKVSEACFRPRGRTALMSIRGPRIIELLQEIV